MKYAILIFFIVLCGCRSSSSSLNSSLREEKNEAEKKETKAVINQEKQSKETVKSEVNTQTEEYGKTTKYYPDGSVSEVQETRRNTGRNELADSSRSKSDVSITDSTSVTDTSSQTKIDRSDQQESKGDSRIVQDIEWLYVAIPVGLVIVIIWYIKKRK